MAESDVKMADGAPLRGDLEYLRRKKFKTSELPASVSQRAAVDSLLYSFKKKGGFDLARKQIWGEFNGNDGKRTFTASLNEMAESEIERDPSLLSRERGKAATLVEGAVDRSDLYKSVEASIDNIASAHLHSILNSLRAIRHEEAGGEISLAEERAGNITDEDYERLIQEKREQREQSRRRELEVQKQKEAEEAKIKAEEVRRQRELRKSREDDDRRKYKEREEQRRVEREKLRQEQRRLDEKRGIEREERYERRIREDKERYRSSARSREERDGREYERNRNLRGDRGWGSRGDRSPGKTKKEHEGTEPVHRETNRSLTPQKPAAHQLDEKSLEDAALELLLKEGKELADKSRQKPEFDFEQAEAIEDSQNQQSQGSQPTVVRLDSKTPCADTTHALHAPNPKEEQNGPCIAGQEKRKSSQDDYDRRRDYGRMDTNNPNAKNTPQHNENTAREKRERERWHRDDRDWEMDRYRPSVRDRRDTEGRLDDTRARRHRDSHSRSRSAAPSRKGKDEEHRDQRSDPDGNSEKDTEQNRYRPHRNRDRQQEQKISPDKSRMSAQEREVRNMERDRDIDRDKTHDRDRDKTRNDERSYRPRRLSGSRSRSTRRRHRSRSEARSRSGSRSLACRSVRDGHRSDSPARGRSKSPNLLEIDRYIPSTSNRSRSPKWRERDRERDSERDRDERGRHCDIDRYVPLGKGSPKPATNVNRDDQRRDRS